MTTWREASRAAVPLALFSFVVTLLRLAGELRGWSDMWFSRATGGLVPVGGVSWLVGITWLAVPFGAWLASSLVRRGDSPEGLLRTLALAASSVFVLYAGTRLVPLLRLGFPGFLLAIWSIGVVAALIAWRAWPALGRPLLVYGLLSRAAVALVMLFAMHGRWGTHYDYADTPQIWKLPFWTAYFAFALVPQLVFWVAFTVVVGIAAGAVSALVARTRRRTPAAAGGR